MTTSNLEKLGEARFIDQLRKNQPVLPVFRDLFKDYGTSNQQIFAGAISSALGLLRDAELKGLKIQAKQKETQDLFNRGSSQLTIDLQRLFV